MEWNEDERAAGIIHSYFVSALHLPKIITEKTLSRLIEKLEFLKESPMRTDEERELISAFQQYVKDCRYRIEQDFKNRTAGNPK